MNVLTNLSLLAVRPHLRGLCEAADAAPTAAGATAALAALFADKDRRLLAALRHANGRAWQALALALDRDLLRKRVAALGEAGKDPDFRRRLKAFLAAAAAQLPRGRTTLLKSCLEELRSPGTAEVLGGKLDPKRLARHAGPMTDLDDPDEVRGVEGKLLARAAGKLARQGYPCLARVLAIQARQDEPLIVGAARHFFRQAVKGDPRVPRAPAEGGAVARSLAALEVLLGDGRPRGPGVADEEEPQTQQPRARPARRGRTARAGVAGGAIREVRTRGERAAAGADLKPGPDYLLRPLPGGLFRVWELGDGWCTAGRSGCDTDLGDPKLSRRHLLLATLGEDRVALNVSSRSHVVVGGQKLHQRTLQDGDLLHLASSWLVFFAGQARLAKKPLRTIQGGEGSRPTRPSWDRAGGPAEAGEGRQRDCLRVLGPRLLAASASPERCLVIGSHPRCAVHVTGPGIAPLHCALVWRPQGPCLFDLESGLGTLLDGNPVKRVPVRHGQKIVVGDRELTVEVPGDPRAAGARLRAAAPRQLRLTVLTGPHAGETAALPAGRETVLGRKGEADLLLPGDTTVSRRHVALKARHDESETGQVVAEVRDLGSRNGTWVNGKPATLPVLARSGAVISLGKPGKAEATVLLLHYDPATPSWL